MKNITPFFEFEGKRYEISKNRYLMAEYQKLQEQHTLSNEDKINAIKLQSLVGDITKYAEKMKELQDIYFEKFDDESENKYLRIKKLYEQKLDELTILEVESGSSVALQKASVDILEQVAIKGLAQKYFNFDERKASEVWCGFVEEIGNNATVEWLTFMAECLFKEEETENDDFLSQMRKMKQQQAINRKKQINK